MNILLVYPPFCSPVTPPYSIANIYSFLKDNTEDNIEVLDLNLEFHKKKFSEYQKYFQNLKDNYNQEEYKKQALDFLKESGDTYSKSNWSVVDANNPELFEEIVELILAKKPDIVAFSVVYSSQSFYTYALAKALKEKGIKVLVGGPAVNEKIMSVADEFQKEENDFLKYLGKESAENKREIDFSVFPLKDYFTQDVIIPLKTSNTCYYQKCAFCTHHGKQVYKEFSTESIRETIKKSSAKKVFLIDDMIHKKRLLEIAKVMEELDVEWMTQLKPTKDFDLETLQKLKDSGLKMIIWGVESGNDRVLEMMSKGTNSKDVSQVLKDAKRAGITNVLYIMFGFPTETKEEFLDTIKFLEDNQDNIDLISTSVFGLQQNTAVYNNPENYSITNIKEKPRTILEPKIEYEVSTGLSSEEASKLRKKYKKTLEKINKYPKEMNFFREHMMQLI